MSLALITALLIPTAAGGESDPNRPSAELAQEPVVAIDCTKEFIERGEEDGWRPRTRWERTVNVGYPQYQRVRLESGVEYRVETCAAADVEDIRISVYDNRAMLRIQSWSETVTFVAPKSGDYSIGVDTPMSEKPPSDVLLLLSSH